MKKVLITGAAGFIGFHLAQKLIKEGYDVWGLDNVNDYYDQDLKWARLAQLGVQKQDAKQWNIAASGSLPNFHFVRMDLVNAPDLMRLFEQQKFQIVVNLAAQAGVRYSLTNPQVYIDCNITGFLNILESCRAFPVENLVFASSSSVYGLNENIPFSVQRGVDHPISLYAASKKANEMMAHSYSHLFGIPATGLRFFTVYGPWGRPDMALFIFTKAILAGEPIDVYNHGEMMRDFTFVDDIVGGVFQVIQKPATPSNQWDAKNPDPSISSAPYRILNIGNSGPVRLMDFIHEIENQLGKKAVTNLLPLQPGDVPASFADVSVLVRDYGYTPGTPISKGVSEFINWYKSYYNV